jgi:hypothetical protein
MIIYGIKSIIRICFSQKNIKWDSKFRIQDKVQN